MQRLALIILTSTLFSQGSFAADLDQVFELKDAQEFNKEIRTLSASDMTELAEKLRVDFEDRLLAVGGGVSDFAVPGGSMHGELARGEISATDTDKVNFTTERVYRLQFVNGTEIDEAIAHFESAKDAGYRAAAIERAIACLKARKARADGNIAVENVSVEMQRWQLLVEKIKILATVLERQTQTARVAAEEDFSSYRAQGFVKWANDTAVIFTFYTDTDLMRAEAHSTFNGQFFYVYASPTEKQIVFTSTLFANRGVDEDWGKGLSLKTRLK